MCTKLRIVTFNDISVVMKYRVVHLCPEMVFIGGARSGRAKPLKFKVCHRPHATTPLNQVR